MTQALLTGNQTVLRFALSTEAQARHRHDNLLPEALFYDGSVNQFEWQGKPPRTCRVIAVRTEIEGHQLVSIGYRPDGWPLNTENPSAAERPFDQYEFGHFIEEVNG